MMAYEKSSFFYKIFICTKCYLYFDEVDNKNKKNNIRAEMLIKLKYIIKIKPELPSYHFLLISLKMFESRLCSFV